MKKLLATLSALAVFLPHLAYADDALKLGDVYDIPVLYTNRGITSGTQTDDLFLAPAIRNNEEISIPSMSGAIFEFSRSDLTETIFATRVTFDSSTNIVTLTGTVIRDVCFNQARNLVTCNSGLTWSKGTEVRLVDSGKRLNRFVDRTRPNPLNASGALSFYGSGSLALPTFASTAERDRQMGATPGGPVRVACVTGDTCYYYLGGSWIKYGSGSTVAATTTVRGGVEMATVSDLSGSVVTGDSGAPLVVGSNLVIRHSTGAINNRNKVVATNNTGYLSGSLLPQLPLNKFNNGTNATSSTFWRGDRTWSAVQTIFGDGSDNSAVWSSNTSLDPTNEYSYTGATLNAGVTLNVSKRNAALIVRSTGNVTINGTINLSGSGGLGGTAGAATQAGGAGEAGSGNTIEYTSTAAAGGTYSGSNCGGGGAGGASVISSGSAGAGGSCSGNNAAAAAKIDANKLALLNAIQRGVVCGGGGGGGGGGGTDAGGAGGKGGGCSLWYIGGNLTLGASSVIRADGTNATNGVGSNAGGGGGGGGGNVVMLVAGTVTNNGVTVSAANGTAGSANNNGGAGGAAGAGSILIYSISTGTLISN